MKKTLLLLLVLGSALVATGCSSASPEEPGYSTNDFSKRPPPPGYGPAGGAPASPPPTNGP